MSENRFNLQIERILKAFSIFFLFLTVLNLFFVFFIQGIDPKITFFGGVDSLSYSFIQALRFNFQVATAFLLPVLIPSILLGIIYLLNSLICYTGRMTKNQGLTRINFKTDIIAGIIHLFNRIFIKVILVVTFLYYLLDWGFYLYLDRHIDLSITNYFYTPKISLMMVWESYPVIWLLLLAVVIGYFIHRSVDLIFKSKIHFRWSNFQSQVGRIVYKPLSILVLLIFFSYGAVGFNPIKLLSGKYPITVSDAYFSKHTALNDIAINPILLMISLVMYNTDDEKLVFPDLTEEELEEVQEYLKSDSYLRIQPPTLKNDGQPPNVVVVVLESFGANGFNQFYENKEVIPNIKELTEKGIFFTNIYSTASRSHYSLFSLLTGFPDLSSEGMSLRFDLDKKPSILDDFVQYKKFFFHNGDLSFVSIKHLLKKLVPDFILFEGHVDSKYAVQNTWGISDYHLFLESHRLLDGFYKSNPDHPFFAIVSTASFHAPFLDFSHESPELSALKLSADEMDKYSESDYRKLNVLHQVDQSVGIFMKKMEESGLHDNTIYIFLGDHGIALPETSISLNKVGAVRHQVHRFHLGALFYAPGLVKKLKSLKSQVVDTRQTASNIDILPSIAAIVGIEVQNRSLGRNLFDSENTLPKMAFTFTGIQSRPRITVIKDQYLFKIQVTNKTKLFAKEVYDLDSSNQENLIDHPDEKIKKLVEEVENYANPHFSMARNVLFSRD